ncbi:DUF4012 domain-containing protein [Parafrankia sp. EUN1f]|uniref:DUF4012 domain-containing protein n=1 Tax=Parafrankia sp. EUN1f TaxID=102897 RepID=UPI0001C44B14|nr:DUF4012 domain-containing protein [Parafrankia sp. EUN1f]EFC82480.1 hypothetical protein FrEUN1fDRAFT_4414 [Parafrankia sp. EUN1f]
MAAALLAVVVSAGVWVGVRGLLARSQLEAARAQITGLQAALSGGAVPGAADLRRTMDEIVARTSSARSLTSDPLWSLAGHLPFAGCPLRSSAALAAALDGVATNALGPVVELGDRLDPSTLRSGTAINVTALASARVPAERARVAVTSFETAVRRVSPCDSLGGQLGINAARSEAVATGEKLHGVLDTLVLATRLGPDLLGASGQRRYLLIVQNPAESRANGGIIGGFGVLTATRGRLELDDISGNGNLPGGPTQRLPAMDLPAEFATRYGQFWPARVWANANLTPDYPTAGQLYSALYRAGTGETVDGTISLDPTTLAYLLAVTGPAVLPDGRTVRADQLVELVESRVYAQIDDLDRRDEFFASVGEAVYQAVITGGGSAGDTAKLLRALARAADEGRLLVSSNHAEEEATLSATALGGALLDVPGPFLGVVTQNASASKLDFWLRRSTEYRIDRRPDGAGLATITVSLTNAAPEGLSDYVRNRGDVDIPGWRNEGAQNNIWISLYTGRGSALVDASLDGKPISLAVGEEKGRPVLSSYLTVDREQTRTLRVRVLEPSAGPVLTLRSQPLTVPELLVVEGLPVERAWSRTVTG